MIITSLLDTDLYKFTMMQVVLHQFPGAQVEYRFKCRNPGVQLAPFVGEIRDEIRSLCSLQFQDASWPTCARCVSSRAISSIFWACSGSTRNTSPSPPALGEIDITIRGPWLHTILFEIPVLAIVNEVYFPQHAKGARFPRRPPRLDAKIALLQADGLGDLKIADYGTRRRFSAPGTRRCCACWWPAWVRATAARAPQPGSLPAPATCCIAMKLGVTPLGTMAHEYLQACQALGPRLRDSQVFGFEMWAKEYRGDLGIALSDVYGMSAFLRDFDLYFCKLFDGARHDSGDPFAWGERLLEHYRKNRVDPLTKT
jgi:nicotinate phosphoribosyltransferase